jgi:hypothetical protein
MPLTRKEQSPLFLVASWLVTVPVTWWFSTEIFGFPRGFAAIALGPFFATVIPLSFCVLHAQNTRARATGEFELPSKVLHYSGVFGLLTGGISVALLAMWLLSSSDSTQGDYLSIGAFALLIVGLLWGQIVVARRIVSTIRNGTDSS